MTGTPQQPPATFRIGCPVWACEHWRGSLYRSNAPRDAWLQQYSSVFNTVECNSTFYALPPIETIRRWARAVAPGFRFSLKVPRQITHDLRLVNATAPLQQFIQAAEALLEQNTLGPSFLQLPPNFSAAESSALEKLLQSLPRQLPWALEVRHADWFDSGPHERWLIQLLTELAIDWVIFDSRPLYSRPPADDVEAISQTRKPRTPLRRTVTARHPFLRFIGRNQLDDVQPWMDEWTPVIAGWIQQGLQPFVFTHAPDDRFAPEFARRLHQAIAAHVTHLEPLARFPGEQEAATAARQRSLF
ncbi:MAG: DUF72 domain-containing protein [Planctomycetaceae bacterium]